MTIPEFTSLLLRDPRRLFRRVQVAALLVLAVADVVLLATARTPLGIFRLEARSTVSSTVQVYFDTGQGFVEKDSRSQPVVAGLGSQVLDFPLPTQPVLRVRIDPLAAPGTLNIHSAAVLRERDFAEIKAFDLESLTAGNEIARLTSNIEGLEVVTTPGSKDSQLGLPLDRPLSLRPSAWQRAAHLLVLDGAWFLTFYAVTFVAFFGWPRWKPGLPRLEAWRFLGRRWFPDRWTALLFAVPLAVFGCYLTATQPASYYLEVVLKADRPVVPRFYFDAGTGYSELASARAAAEASDTFQTVRLPIPVRTIKALRFDPARGPVAMRVNTVAVRSDAEDWLGLPPLFSFDLRTLWPVQGMKELVHEDDGTIRLLVEDEVTDPITALTLPAPVILGLNGSYVARRLLLFTVGWLLLWAAGAEILLHLPGAVGRVAASALARSRLAWRKLTPVRSVWLVAVASVVVSCYPVLFFGKSFSSPNFEEGTFQLYGRFPTLPGTGDLEHANGRGADLGSMAWAHGPYAVVESRALWRDGEWPLWNRYNYAGVPLLGQGQSMVGDPLHGLVLAAGGRAWAWDAKFVLAKGLFAAGVGLLVLGATGSLPAALLLCASSAFIGFFSYRLNHPAYFSLCYAPWIVLAWLRITQAVDWRRAGVWLAGLILANWMEFNSGSIADGYAVALCLNLYGLWTLLLSRHSAQYRFRRLLGVVAAALLFYGLIAPLLLPFANTLKRAAESASAAGAGSLSPGLLLGVFDDVFYRQLTFAEKPLLPSTNFLVLLGILLTLGGIRRLLGNRSFDAALLGAALPLAAVFGCLPLGLLRALAPAALVPQIGPAFSSALIVPLFVLAGFGLKQSLTRPSRPRWLRGLAVAAVGGAALLTAYFALMATPGRGGQAALKLGQDGAFSAFFLSDVPLLLAAALLLPFVLRRVWLRGPAPATVALLACCLFLLHWRQGLHLPGPLANYTPVPADRTDLLSHPPAIDLLQADRSGPFRAVGLGTSLTPGQSALAGVEGIDGRESLVSPYFADLEAVGLQLTPERHDDAADKARLAATRRFYDLLNVRYYLARSEESLADLPDLQLVARLDLDVYRNATAWPRAFFVDRLEDYSGVREFVNHVNAPDPLPFAAVEVSEYRLHPELAGRFATSRQGRTVVPAMNYRLTNNRTTFDVIAPRAGVIVLGEGFDRDGFATVNGHRAAVLRVNHAFKGVAVDGPGLYHVTFGYRPPFFTLALWTSALGWILLCAGVLSLYRGTVRRVTGARKDLPAPPTLP